MHKNCTNLSCTISDHPGDLYMETDMTEKDNDFTVEHRASTKIPASLGYSA